MMGKDFHSEQVEQGLNKFREKGPCDNVSAIPQVKQFGLITEFFYNSGKRMHLTIPNCSRESKDMQ